MDDNVGARRERGFVQVEIEKAGAGDLDRRDHIGFRQAPCDGFGDRTRRFARVLSRRHRPVALKRREIGAVRAAHGAESGV